MAATHGHGNPDWTRDETLLALDLYFRAGQKVPDKKDPRISALSDCLRSLPIHPDEAKRETFRNPAGVGLKLHNLHAAATGRGMKNASATDREVWGQFGSDPLRVRALVEQILAVSDAGIVTHRDIPPERDEEEFIEGRVLTALHRRRERDPKARMRLLEARSAAGRLRCDCCDDGPKATRAELAFACFEAHHIMPLAQTEGSVATKIKDLALLCAVCHRLIHHAMRQEGRWINVDELRVLLSTDRAG